MTRVIHAPRGNTLTCKGWQQEAAYRMLQNNLDPAVAERPDDLVVYGGRGQAARSWEAYDVLLATLKELEDDETLLVQSGQAVAVFKSHADAPRVLIANSNLVPHWATQPVFDDLAAKGLIMYGQMTAGSWIYIGSQGILQGTYETLGALARQRGWPSLRGKLVLSAGLGGMGGAQPLAVTLNEGVALMVEVDPARAQRRLETGYVDVVVDKLEEAMTLAQEAQASETPRSIALIGNAAAIYPELVLRGITPDVVTDQTPAHDYLAYVPPGLTLAEADALRRENPGEYACKSAGAMARQVEAMLAFRQRGAEVFDYGNNLRQRAFDAGVKNAFDYPGFVPAYVRPLFCEGKGPFRWVALSGDPEDIYRTDAAVLELFPEDEHLRRWLTLAREKVSFQGLPARICWLGYGERARAGVRFNELVAQGIVSAPIVIGRDHLDAGSVASPNRETEAMRDGSDAISDWPILNALINAVGGATWVSFHHGGGVGIGYSQHAGQVIVADGTPEAARRLERVLTTDPGMGIVRHADAGYPEAIAAARRHGLKMPMFKGLTVVTIRRLYQYVVCFISLQAAAAALNTLLGGVVSWVVGADRPDAFFFTLQLAIFIVATPIFLGHWLWVLAGARRDPAERGAFLYHFYLYITQTVFLVALAGAVFNGVDALARFVFLRATTNFPTLIQVVGVSVVTLALMGALWLYHQLLLTRRDLPQSPATRGLFHIYTLGWAGVGAALAAIGLFLVQAALIDRLAGNPSLQGPTGLGLLAAGLPLWLFHEFDRARRRALAAPLGDALRWLSAAAISAVGVFLILFGLADVLTRLAERLFLGAADHPPYALAIFTVGLGLWAYHEWAVRRVAGPAFRPLRWLYAALFSAVGLVAAASGGVAGLQWLFGGLRQGVGAYASSAALFWPGLLVWAYHQWVWRQTSRALGFASAEPGSFRDAGRLLQRLYLLAFSGVGVTLATLGLIGVQAALFTGQRAALDLRQSLAWLLVGVPLWLYHWVWVGRLFAAGLPDERRSDLRKLYLYVIIFAAVNTVITTAGLTLQGLFRRLLSLPTTGQLGLSVAIILAALALWVYHAFVLRGDIARAAESSLQGGLQRLYWYLVATFGLAAFLLGLAGVLSALISLVAAGLQADADLRGQLALNLAALIAGLPVWLLAWWPAQAATRPTGPAGVAARRSWLRRLYLYGFALTAVIVTLVSAIAVVYQLLNAVLRLGEGGNVLANMARSVGLAIIFTAVWLYHAWVLRQDGRHTTADRAVETEQRAAERAAAVAATTARWAGFTVAVVDDGDGRFARLALAALRRDLPTLRLLPVGLNPAAVAALAAEPPSPAEAVSSAPVAAQAEPAADKTVFAAPDAPPPIPDALSVARLIVAPWTAAAREPIVSSRLPKVIVPLPGPGLYWAGVSPQLAAALPTDPGAQLARTVEAALMRLTEQPPAPPSAAPAPTELTNSPIPAKT